jgi:hypothetical protein
MAPKPGMLAFVFGMVLAMGMTILSITTWAAPRILRESGQRHLRRRKRYTGLKIGLCTKGSASSPR